MQRAAPSSRSTDSALHKQVLLLLALLCHLHPRRHRCQWRRNHLPPLRYQAWAQQQQARAARQRS
jgi:hypothetical protein